MGKPTGFLEIGRELPDKRPVAERIQVAAQRINEAAAALAPPGR